MNTATNSSNVPQDPNTFSMNLEEARKVPWLKNHPRPMGELYDEGYLNRARLEWAVAKAYDLRLKRAALVFLKQPKPEKPAEKVENKAPFELPGPALSIGIILEQAKATEWPFPPFKGQLMGMLVETKQLSLKDLGFAAEKAYEERVRQAATALMLVQLNQNVKEPAPSAGFMKVISGGRSFAEGRQLQIALLEGGILGAIAGFMLAVCIWTFRLSASAQSTATQAVASKSFTSIAGLLAILFLVGLYALGNFLSSQILRKLDKQIDNYREGQKGEEKVVEVILQTLDGNWSLFRNIQLPGRNKADLDAVLVGPAGVWALEIKNFSGIYRNIGERWEYRAKKGWNLYRKSPSRQAQNGAVRLGNFLKADGIKQWVEAAVVWANQENPITVENPSVAVWPLERLPDELGNAWQEEKVPADMRARIVEKLTKLCERQEEARNIGVTQGGDN